VRALGLKWFINLVGAWYSSRFMCRQSFLDCRESCRIYRSVVSRFEVLHVVLSYVYLFFRITIFIDVYLSDISYFVLIAYILLIV
jgi:hypothetical protein